MALTAHPARGRKGPRCPGSRHRVDASAGPPVTPDNARQSYYLQEPADTGRLVLDLVLRRGCRLAAFVRARDEPAAREQFERQGWPDFVLDEVAPIPHHEAKTDPGAASSAPARPHRQGEKRR